MAPLVEAMRGAIAAERERTAEIAAESESLEQMDSDDAIHADEDEDED